MQEAYWGYWLILLGVFVTVIMLLIQGMTTSNTQDYYQLKEITEASMTESIDYAYYRLYGEVKINKEKFVENFVRRFAETVTIATTYKIDFFDLYEAPPKVSVRVTSASSSFNIYGDETSFDVINKLDAILETNVVDNGPCSYYANTGGNNNNSSNNNSSNNSGSNNGSNNGSSGSACIHLNASTLTDYIIKFGVRNAYYTNVGAVHEKTSLGNIRGFVCSDIASQNICPGELDNCKTLVEQIYSSLPEYIN